MKKKLFLIFTFFIAISAIFLFKSVSSANAAGYISAQDPYSPLGGYSDANRVDISITLVDSVTGNGIVGDVHLWSTYPTDSCGSSVQGTVDSTKTASAPNYNPDFPVSCAHGIWVEAKNSPGHYDFSPYCLQCASNTCYLYGHNGQYVFYKIHLDPIPVTPAASAPGNPINQGLPACVNTGSKYGSGITLQWDNSTDVTDYEVQFTRTNGSYGDFATKIVTASEASGTGGWSANGNSNVTWLSGTNLNLDPATQYYWHVRARGPGGNSQYRPLPEINTSGAAGVGINVAACAASAPTVTLTASPNPVAYNTASTLTWTISGSPTSCTNTLNMPAGSWSSMSNGSASTGALTANKTYTLTCTNAGGSTPASVTVSANPPLDPSITSCSISPTTVVVGQNVTISATVKNNRATAISTQGPDSGFGYTEAQSFSSLGYPAVAGKFRIGIDNGGVTYPWRWGFGPPTATTLAAGASTTITGTITMGTVGTKNLTIGLVEETIAWRATGQCPTAVTVIALPANPSGLTVATSCNGSSPEVLFSFTDNSTNEDAFYLDVNGAAWTGPSLPSPWGVKTIVTANKSGVGGAVNYIWKTSDPLSGTPTLPAGGTQYYWRVKAHSNTDGDSSHIYPANTITPPGTAFTTPVCSSDLILRNAVGTAIPVVTVNAPASLLDNTISVQTNTSFMFGFRTKNISSVATGISSCTNVSAAGSSLVGPANACTAVATTGSQLFAVPNLDPNAITTMQALALSYPAAGSYTITIKADWGGVITESDETNNEIVLTVNVTAPPVPANPSALSVVTACSAGLPTVTFTFTDNSTTEDLFWLDVNGAAWTGAASPSPWGLKTITRSAAQKTATGAPPITFTWDNTAATNTAGPMDSGDVDGVTGAPAVLTPANSRTYYWRVKAHDNANNLDSAHIYPPSATTAPGTSFTTPNCTPPTVTLTANPNPVAYNTVSTLTWTISGSPTSCTNTLNMPAGNWSTMNNGNAGTGALVANKTYTLTCTNAGGSTPASVTVTVNPLTYDLKAEFVDTTWRYGVLNTSFNPAVDQLQPNVIVTVDVKVTNLNASGTPSPLTDLYIYYQTGNPDVPICPDPPGHAATIVPGDAAGPTNQGYPVLAINSTAATTASFRTISVSFQIGTAGNTVTAYVGPRCDLNDPDWNGINSNVDSQQYIVATVGFFETLGGDVGAAFGKEVGVRYNSSVIPKYQSDYLIAAGTIDSNVSSRNNWKLNNYDKRQAPSAGVYDYFINKFPNPNPADSTCAYTPVKPIAYCNSNFSGGGNPTGSRVIFVRDNLEINSNIELNSNEAVVFIVKGDIIVHTNVNRIDGIYIARHSFIDHDDAAGPAIAAAGDALTVNGAIYVDGIDNGSGAGTIDIGRYFSAAINNQYAPVKVVYDPKYLLLMRDLIGVKSIVWKEVAP